MMAFAVFHMQRSSSDQTTSVPDNPGSPLEAVSHTSGTALDCGCGTSSNFPLFDLIEIDIDVDGFGNARLPCPDIDAAAL